MDRFYILKLPALFFLEYSYIGYNLVNLVNIEMLNPFTVCDCNFDYGLLN